MTLVFTLAAAILVALVLFADWSAVITLSAIVVVCFAALLAICAEFDRRRK